MITRPIRFYLSNEEQTVDLAVEFNLVSRNGLIRSYLSCIVFQMNVFFFSCNYFRVMVVSLIIIVDINQLHYVLCLFPIRLIRYVEMFSIISIDINIMMKISQVVGICNDKIATQRKYLNLSVLHWQQ